MANLPSAFKPRTTPIEACTAARASMRHCKPRKARVLVSGSLVSCASWSWLRVDLGIGPKRRTVIRAHGWLRTAWIGTVQPRGRTKNGPGIALLCGPLRAASRGRLCFAAVLDLFSRRVVGWDMAALADETLVEGALHMALSQRRQQAGLLHHTDRGCHYTSHAYQARLSEMSITVSMSRTGNCWENAVSESFFGTLKGECVDLICFQTRTEARQTVFECVECFYNRVRLHSSLGYVSPVVFEQQHLQS